MTTSETSIGAPSGPVCCGRGRLSLLRQAQLVAAGLVLASFLLGTLVAPAWHAIAVVVGLGLVHAGVTGRCGMATLLGRLPWNRGAPAF